MDLSLSKVRGNILAGIIMSLPGYLQWVSETALGVTKPRSLPLKTVDLALQQYELQKTPPNLFRVKNAFEDWKRSKDAAWESSERNRKQAITRLNDALATADYRAFQITQFSMQELMALKYVNEQRKRVIARVFQGKEVNLKARVHERFD